MPAAKPAAPKPTAKVVTWSIIGVVGLGGAYYLYKHYQATGSLNPFSSAGTTAAAPSPTPTPTPGSSTSPTTPITTLAQWKTAILAYMVSNNIPGGENVAATALASALSGHCLGPNEFKYLNQALGSVGQPPGTGILTLAQCKAPAKKTTTHTPSEAKKPPVAHAPTVLPPVVHAHTVPAHTVTERLRHAVKLPLPKAK